MMNRSRRMVAVAALLIALLAGCGGNTPATGTPAPTADTGGNSADSAAVTVAPLGAAPASVNVNGIKTGEFQLNFSGSITADVRGSGLAQVSAGSSPEKSITLLLYASGANDSPARGVTVVFPDSLTPGTYAVQSYYGVFAATGQVTGVGAVISEPGTANDSAAALFDATGGELALTSVDPITGTLTVDAKSEDGSTTVKVQGTFNQITVVRAS